MWHTAIHMWRGGGAEGHGCPSFHDDGGAESPHDPGGVQAAEHQPRDLLPADRPRAAEDGSGESERQVACAVTHMRVSSSPGQRRVVETPLRSSPVVLLSLAYAVVCLVLEALIIQGRGNGQLRAEVLALRHQLRVLERRAGRPRWQPCDRLLLVAISRVLTRPAWRSLLPSPETLLRWHRELVHQKWAAYRRRPRRHRPMPRSELHQLILRLAGELKVGLSPHSGRAPQARPPLLSLDRPQSAPSPRLTASASPRPAQLARIRSPIHRHQILASTSSRWIPSG
jgi:hypothetical protein